MRISYIMVSQFVATRLLRHAVALAVLMVLAAGVACSDGDAARSTAGTGRVLIIGGIPDQNVSALEERFEAMAAYLESQLWFNVEYRPAVSYTSLVTAFDNGEVKLGWFGGFTGVQARLVAEGAQAIAQRPQDEVFRSVFIVGRDVPARSLAELKGLTFTFGSESSTSGHIMPRSFLVEAGVDPESDFRGPPSYSGSHDKTWRLVESGSFQAGALSSAVWDRAVAEGQVDTGKVSVVHITDPYPDYHWVAHPDLDETYGAGATEAVRQALMAMSPGKPDSARVLELFQTDAFIRTRNENYAGIEDVARQLGLIE